MIKIYEITGPSAFEDLSEDWSSLLDRVRNPRSSQSLDWCLEWWEALASPIRGAKLLVLRFEFEGKAVAILPFVEGEQKNPLRVNFLRSFGVAAAFMRHSLVEENTWLIEDGMEAEVLQALAHYVNARQTRWDAVAFRYQAQDPEPAEAILRAAFSGWKKAQVEIVNGSDIAPLATDWGAQRKALSRSMRDNIPYYPKRMTRASLNWSLEFIRNPDEIQSLIPQLIALHKMRAASNKMFHHDDYLSGPAEEAFVRSVMRWFSRDRQGSVGVVRVDGEIIAMQVYFDYRDELVVWYSGFDDRYRAYCPIFIIQTEAIRLAIDRGLRKVNFLRTKRFWTLKWGAKTLNDTILIRLVSRRPLSKARLAVHYARHLLRTRYSQIRTSTQVPKLSPVPDGLTVASNESSR